MRPPIRAVTFDAAGTLIRVRWQPGSFAVSCAAEAGIELDEQVARERYDRLLQSRWKEYAALNRTRDAARCQAFWHELTQDWLDGEGVASPKTVEVMEVAEMRLYGANGTAFNLYEDALPTLKAAREVGAKLAIVSNWDVSLHRILRSLGITEFFDVVVASLEEGFEKPDPRLFHVALSRLDVSPELALHVGDDPVDDVQGARAAGMRAIRLDRDGTDRSDGCVSSLLELSEVLGWSR